MKICTVVIVMALCGLLGAAGVSGDYTITPEVQVTWGYKPDLFSDAYGNLHMIAIDGGLRYLYKPVDTTWYEAHNAAVHIPGSEIISEEWSRPTLAADNEGNAFVAWTISDSLFFCRKMHGVWEGPWIIANKRGSGWCTVADCPLMYDSVHNILHVVYSRAMDGGWSIWHMYSPDKGLTWMPEDRACWDGITPTGECDASGNLHIGFHQGCGEAYNVWNPQTATWAYGDDGQGINYEKCIDEVTLTCSPDGTPHCIWPPFECQGDDCYYVEPYYSRKVGNSWTPPIPVSDDIDYRYAGGGFPYIPQAAAFSQREAVMFFAWRRHGMLYASYMKDDQWVKDIPIGQTDSGHFAVTRAPGEAVVTYRRGGTFYERRFQVSKPADWQINAWIDTNQEVFMPGDSFELYSALYSGETDCKDVDLYIVLEVAGQYWFAPTWTADFVDKSTIQICPPLWSATVLSFIWPEGAGTLLDGLYFHMAATGAGGLDLAGGDGGYAYCQFGFTEPTPTPEPTLTPVPPTETP
ncbi:hypothetical protein JW905_15940, partial [bacterium]|nr:hypothetical protein [candidate division CSSED10-310 bacterium]